MVADPSETIHKRRTVTVYSAGPFPKVLRHNFRPNFRPLFRVLYARQHGYSQRRAGTAGGSEVLLPPFATGICSYLEHRKPLPYYWKLQLAPS